MSGISDYYDFTSMYNGKYEVVEVTPTSLILRPIEAPNQVVYPEYLGGARIILALQEMNLI